MVCYRSRPWRRTTPRRAAHGQVPFLKNGVLHPLTELTNLGFCESLPRAGCERLLCLLKLPAGELTVTDRLGSRAAEDLCHCYVRKQHDAAVQRGRVGRPQMAGSTHRAAPLPEHDPAGSPKASGRPRAVIPAPPSKRLLEWRKAGIPFGRRDYIGAARDREAPLTWRLGRGSWSAGSCSPVR